MPEVSERRTVPVADRDSLPYWSALSEGRFMLQRCAQCGRWTWPPRPICSGCHGDQLTWEAPSGKGAVYSWVVTHQPYSPDLARIVPYTVALVRIDEQDDILIPGRFISEGEIHQGLAVHAVAEPVSEDVGVLNWEPATKP